MYQKTRCGGSVENNMKVAPTEAARSPGNSGSACAKKDPRRPDTYIYISFVYAGSKHTSHTAACNTQQDSWTENLTQEHNLRGRQKACNAPRRAPRLGEK